MFGDEINHLIRHAAQQTLIDYRPHMFGHISTYDPATHRVRCIIPSLTDDDGTPLLSPWMPMGTPFGGVSGGVQYIYKGGATVQNPTAGEQVLISMFDRVRGLAAVPCTFFSAVAAPPATNLPTQKQGWTNDAPAYGAGDVLISNAPTATGQANKANSLIRITGAGNIEIWGATSLVANIQGDADVTSVNGNVNVTATNGNATVTAHGIASIIAPAIQLCAAITDALQTFCTKALHDWAIIHVHGNGPPSSTPMPANSLTTIVTGE